MTREVWIGMLTVMLTGGALYHAYEREQKQGLRFALAFEDAGGLKSGDSVFLAGVDVGEVQDVDLTDDRKVQVAVKLSDRFKRHVLAESQFMIASDKFLFGKKAIVVMPPAGAGTPVQEGQHIKGVEGYTDLYVSKTTTGAKRLWSNFKGWLKSPPEDKPEDPPER